jgi:hypothetical protein
VKPNERFPTPLRWAFRRRAGNRARADFRHSIPYPVAIKVIGVEHKTEVGGIALDVQNREAFMKHVKGKDVLVQRMAKGLAEAIVGYRNDPVVGPLVLVGAGGTLAELYQDVALALAPVTEEEAMAMIDQVKGLGAAAIATSARRRQGAGESRGRAFAAMLRGNGQGGRDQPAHRQRQRRIAVDALVNQGVTMDFRLAPEQQQFRDSVLKFSRKELLAGALARAHDSQYPWDVAKKMAKQGLLGITIAEADGGQGGTLMDAVLAIESVAAFCPRRCQRARIWPSGLGRVRFFFQKQSFQTPPDRRSGHRSGHD